MLLNALDIDMHVAVKKTQIIIELVVKNSNAIPLRVDKNRVGLLVGNYIDYLTINHVDGQGKEIPDKHGYARLSSRVATGYRGPWLENQIAEIPANGEIKASFDISNYFTFIPGCNRYSIEYFSSFDVPLVLNQGKFDEPPPGAQALYSKTKPIFFEYCKNE